MEGQPPKRSHWWARDTLAFLGTSCGIFFVFRERDLPWGAEDIVSRLGEEMGPPRVPAKRPLPLGALGIIVGPANL